MRKPIWTLLALALLCFTGGTALAQPDIAEHQSCPFCGMDRGQFAHSRVYIQFEDGTSFGACSLHCAAIELAVKIDKTVKSIQVGDYNTKALIDAEKAFWTIGGSKMGVMTKRAKWAFSTKEAAEAYVKENGGDLADFETVMKAAYEDMYQDTRMIREKRKMMRMAKEKGKS
jgi:nitrous oxide reductase accessory protein NosL